jgi:hypothetical protein
MSTLLEMVTRVEHPCHQHPCRLIEVLKYQVTQVPADGMIVDEWMTRWMVDPLVSPTIACAECCLPPHLCRGDSRA